VVTSSSDYGMDWIGGKEWVIGGLDAQKKLRGLRAPCLIQASMVCSLKLLLRSRSRVLYQLLVHFLVEFSPGKLFFLFFSGLFFFPFSVSNILVSVGHLKDNCIKIEAPDRYIHSLDSLAVKILINIITERYTTNNLREKQGFYHVISMVFVIYD